MNCLRFDLFYIEICAILFFIYWHSIFFLDIAKMREMDIASLLVVK